jgi:hypothetical protein
LSRRTLSRGLLAAFVLLALPYAWAPWYRFPDPAPFAGAEWLNPYADAGTTWQRANLHAHGRAWSGITNGTQPDEEIARRYRALGYDVPGVSDYQRIASLHDQQTVPLYEHGFNIGKHHQIAIGAHAVSWFDFPLWQGAMQQQYVIDRVKHSADLVALAHPNSRYAYSSDDLQQLTGYDLLEVVNGPFTAEDSWDAALSSGRPVWGVANDDTHDLTDVRRLAAGWNMIAAASADTAAIVQALKAGRSYAVLRTGAIDSSLVTTLSKVDVSGSTLSVRCTGAPSTITFIGQNGAVRRVVKDVLAAEYALAANDTYVRTVIETPQTVLFLNPVLRYDGRAVAMPVATVDSAATWLQRAGIAGVCAALTVYFRRRRYPNHAAAPRAVLADVNEKPA